MARRFAEKPILWIASNLRFAIFRPPERDSKKGLVREPPGDSQESGDSRESANRFARIGPSKFSGAPGISGQKSRQKVSFPWILKDIPTFLAPTPSHERLPPHRKISGPKRLSLCSFFLPEFDVCVRSLFRLISRIAREQKTINTEHISASSKPTRVCTTRFE